MSFKLVVLFALVAAITCATFDSREQEEGFTNHGTFNNKNDQRRGHEQSRLEGDRRVHHPDRFDENRRNEDRFDDSRYHNEQVYRNRGFFEQRVNPQNPTFLHLQPAVFNVQSSSRHFNVKDDSNYDIAYSVSDMTTGDIKSHQETRRGDEVNGQYTIVDSDGFQRRVNYRANDRDGFDAEVKREPIVGLRYSGNYQAHDVQNNFNNNQQFPNHQLRSGFNQNQQFNSQLSQNDQFNHNQNAQFLTHPKSVATVSVSKTEDGQHNQYMTTTTTN